MEKVLSALAEIKAYFAGLKDALAKLTAAEERAKALETDLAAARAETATRDQMVSSLEGNLAAAREQVTALEAKVEAEKNRANETLASQGINPDQLPAAGVRTNPKESAFATYTRLFIDGKHKEAANFYAENAEAIIKSRTR